MKNSAKRKKRRGGGKEVVESEGASTEEAEKPKSISNAGPVIDLVDFLNSPVAGDWVYNPAMPLPFETEQSLIESDLELIQNGAEVFVHSQNGEDYGYDSELDYDPEIEGVVRKKKADEFSSQQMWEQHRKVLKLYKYDGSIEEIKQEVEHILEVEPNCAEAYNLLALRTSSSYEEALDYYYKAHKLSVHVGKEVERAKRDRCLFLYFPGRPLFRALLGIANTLRKMRKYEEALSKYLELSKYDTNSDDSDPMYINCRYHIPELYMKLGKWEEAYFYMNSNPQADRLFSGPRTLVSFMWNYALCEYKYKKLRDCYVEKLTSKLEAEIGKEKRGLWFDGFTVVVAASISPIVVDYLSGDARLRNVKLPTRIGTYALLSSTVAYCSSHLELWRSVDGACEWAMKNLHTFLAYINLRSAITMTQNKLRLLHSSLRKGTFLKSPVQSNGATLLHFAISRKLVEPAVLLLKHGSDPNFLTKDSLSAMHIACYYDLDVEFIDLMMEYGADPFLFNTEQGVLSAFAMAANQGNWRILEAILQKHKGYIPNIIMEQAVDSCIDSSVYSCLKGGVPCQRCSDSPELGRGHTQDASLEKCIDILVAKGARATPALLVHEEECPLATYYKSVVAKLEKAANKSGESKEKGERGADANADLKNESSKNSVKVIKSKLKIKVSKYATAPVFLTDERSPLCWNCRRWLSRVHRCSKCKSVFYCSPECQEMDWRIHKKYCHTYPSDSDVKDV